MNPRRRQSDTIFSIHSFELVSAIKKGRHLRRGKIGVKGTKAAWSFISVEKELVVLTIPVCCSA